VAPVDSKFGSWNRHSRTERITLLPTPHFIKTETHYLENGTINDGVYLSIRQPTVICKARNVQSVPDTVAVEPTDPPL
jgi:hypothetical protein